MLPKLSKDNLDHWFNHITKALHAKKVWWIIATLETVDYSTHMAILILLWLIIPNSKSDLLDKYLRSAVD
jgi:hypothetical protein